MGLKIILANPRGYCAGVVRAVEAVERLLKEENIKNPQASYPLVYVYHEIVHNPAVLQRLRSMGAVFVEDLSEVPDDSILVFSAHGVSDKIETEAIKRNLRIMDATCPLVSKVHLATRKFTKEGMTVVVVGHANHQEVKGIVGRIYPGSEVFVVENVDDVSFVDPIDSNHIAYVTQTTLSIDEVSHIMTALKKKFPNIVGLKKGDVCYATKNRQSAVKNLLLGRNVDLLLVIGAANSSNSNRLREIGTYLGTRSELICDRSAIDLMDLLGNETVVLTAGASTPEYNVEDILKALNRKFTISEMIESPGVLENVHFKEPIFFSNTN